MTYGVYAHLIIEYWNQDISVGITVSYELDGRGSDSDGGKVFSFCKT
jgi:hypothetical protein